MYTIYFAVLYLEQFNFFDRQTMNGHGISRAEGNNKSFKSQDACGVMLEN